MFTSALRLALLRETAMGTAPLHRKQSIRSTPHGVTFRRGSSAPLRARSAPAQRRGQGSAIARRPGAEEASVPKRPSATHQRFNRTLAKIKAWEVLLADQRSCDSRQPRPLTAETSRRVWTRSLLFVLDWGGRVPGGILSLWLGLCHLPTSSPAFVRRRLARAGRPEQRQGS